MKYIIYILFAIGCYLSVTHWLNNFNISPDSTNYITASENLAKHQSLFVYSNWPSHSYEPNVEPYTEYMPGLPIFSSVGFLFTDNPDTVMLVMNTVNIILLYFISLLLMYELKLQGYLKVAFILFLVFFEPFRFIFSYFWTETLFIALTLLAVFFAIKLLKEDTKKYWLLGCIAVALSAFVKMYGVFNCIFFLVPFIMYKKKFSKLIIFTLLSSLFVVLWCMRNEVAYGYFTSSHKIFQQFFSSNIKRPFNFTLFLLGNDKLANVWAIVVVLFSLSPLVLYIRKNIVNDFKFKAWIVLCIGTIINFLGIYVLSLVSSFDYLESRLLASVYILGLLIFIVSSKILFEVFYLNKIKYAFIALPFLFFAVNPAFTKNVDWKVNVHYPIEHSLWNEINGNGLAKNSSHYITDFDYIYQIYGDKPQRIISQGFMFLNIKFLYEITNKGTSPFVVLRNNELPYFYFEKLYKFLNYKKADIQNNSFTVYVKNN